MADGESRPAAAIGGEVWGEGTMTEGLLRWRDKVAVVTGASGGIGLEIVRRLAREGMRVAFCARTEAALEKLAAEITALGGEALPVVADLRQQVEIQRLFDRVRERWGGVDVLVNNAGVGFDAPLLAGDPAHWRVMLELNVLALCIATQIAVGDMQARDVAGHVIHIGSMAGHRVPPGSGMYSASKFAVRSLTDGLRHELRQAGSDVRVSCISPGFVETGFAAHWHHGDEQPASQTYSRFPVLQAVDIADAVAWTLATPQHVQVHDILLRPTRQEN